jgi:hypothetical protein
MPKITGFKNVDFTDFCSNRQMIAGFAKACPNFFMNLLLFGPSLGLFDRNIT